MHTEQLDTLDDFRLRCAELFDALPEPPIYRRAEDPVRERIPQLVPRVETLLSEASRLKDSGHGAKEASELADALVAMRETVGFVSQDQFNRAEETWLKFLNLKEQALSNRKLWQASTEELPAVFDRATGSSRFDPVEYSGPSIQLACPNRPCGRAALYSASLSSGRGEFRCSHCGKSFVAYLAEVKELKVESKSRSKTRYNFRLGESNGAQTKVQFDDSSSSILRVARGDNVALIYPDGNELRAALNLNTGRILWITRPGACFIASTVFGAQAPELEVFRAFRDEYLQRHWQGRIIITGYYFVGPALVTLINFLGLRPSVRRFLLRVYAALKNRGY